MTNTTTPDDEAPSTAVNASEQPTQDKAPSPIQTAVMPLWLARALIPITDQSRSETGGIHLLKVARGIAATSTNRRALLSVIVPGVTLEGVTQMSLTIPPELLRSAPRIGSLTVKIEAGSCDISAGQLTHHSKCRPPWNGWQSLIPMTLRPITGDAFCPLYLAQLSKAVNAIEVALKREEKEKVKLPRWNRRSRFNRPEVGWSGHSPARLSMCADLSTFVCEFPVKFPCLAVFMGMNSEAGPKFNSNPEDFRSNEV